MESSKFASIGRLAAGVGHEINNPLAIITGYVSILEKNADQKTKETTSKIKAAVGRISNIVNTLRTYSRKDSDKADEVSINKTVESTILLLGEVYKTDKVYFYNNIDKSNEYFIKGFSSKLQQVLMNLFKNAYDAMENSRRKEIEIDLEKVDKNFVQLSVRDYGTGMDESTRAKIFDPFFTTKAVGKGTGLGMGIVKGFVEEIGGEIFVNSQKGLGTTFRLKFPLMREEKQSLDKTKQANPPQSIEADVLYVEDEEELRTLVKGYLENMGCSVDLASDGDAALEKIKDPKNLYHLVITDLKMPRMSGQELADQISNLKEGQKPPVFVLSGGAEADLAKLKNIEGYMLKPFTESDLREVVTQYVSLKSKAA